MYNIVVHVYCIQYLIFIASFAVFLDFNCLTLIACLNFLLVEFSLSKKSAQIKTLIAAATAITLLDTNSAVAAASTNNADIFYYFRESPTSKSNANGKELFRSNSLSLFPSSSSLLEPASSSSSLSKSSTVTSSSNFLENLLIQQASSRNSKRKQPKSNSPTRNSNGILLIHSNENKNSSSSLFPLSLFPSSSSSLYPLASPSSLSKQKDNDNSISVSKNKQQSNNASDITTYNYEQTREVTKFQGKRHSVSKRTENKRAVPQGKFPAPQFTLERQQKEKTGATAAAVLAIDPFPVSFLTNSQYEFESPLMLTNPLGVGGMNDGESNHDMDESNILLGRTRSSSLNNAKVQRVSGRSSHVHADDDAEEYPNSPSIEYLAMPLQGGTNDEILLNFTTLSPAMAEVSTMFVGSPQDFESPSPSPIDNNSDTNETLDIDDKAILYNQTAGKVHIL